MAPSRGFPSLLGSPVDGQLADLRDAVAAGGFEGPQATGDAAAAHGEEDLQLGALSDGGLNRSSPSNMGPVGRKPCGTYLESPDLTLSKNGNPRPSMIFGE